MHLPASYLFSFTCLAFLYAKYHDACFGGGKCGPVPERIRLFSSTRKSLVLVPHIALSMCRALSYNYRFVHDKNIRYFGTLSKVLAALGYLAVHLRYLLWNYCHVYFALPAGFSLILSFIKHQSSVHPSTHLATHPFKRECYIPGQWGRCGCCGGGCRLFLHLASDFPIKSCIRIWTNSPITNHRPLQRMQLFQILTCVTGMNLVWVSRNM